MAKEIKKITTRQLSDLLLKGDVFNGCSFAGISSMTEEKLAGGKKNPMQGRVQKVNNGQLVMLFTNKTTFAYENMVNKRLGESGEKEDFQAKQNWFRHIKGTTLVHHKDDIDKLYLQVIYAQRAESMLEFCENNAIRVEPADREIFDNYVKSYQGMKQSDISYLLDGKPIAKEKIEGLAVDKEEGSQGGLRKEMKVITRVFKMESITSLTIGGVQYIIEN